ncbi:hypothetical protein SAY86_026061 [Trapa natans]|uniref:BHLH domain-containing protein n=1 Tax=Trapa natans TaxID=22666 RepID=A0AAN7QE63_TRANT|nr:hypothetical protein SAY86_026061 [Trapa natans]
MDLETAVFQLQDPVSCKDPRAYSLPRDYYTDYICHDHDHDRDMENYSPPPIVQANLDDSKDNTEAEMGTNSSASSEDGSSGAAGGFPFPDAVAVTVVRRRKRRRTITVKNKEDVESQRMTHIAVERNRRRQMNEYLAILRSMMPPSYVRRGDQASIVGGAINFVKELEQLHLLSLKKAAAVHKETHPSSPSSVPPQLQNPPSIFSDFFTFPQYSTGASGVPASNTATVADVEVAVVEGHANIKVRSRWQPAQLLKMVVGLHSLHLYVLHLTLTAADPTVFFSFCVKVEESSQLNSANEIAAVVYEMICRIQGEANSHV